MKIHWTGRSIKDYIFRIATDFIAQLDKKMESPPLSQDALAKKLGVSKSRVSQVFNSPGNIELETIVKFSNALNMKVAIVAYDDDDPKPIDSEIFKICWERAGKPHDFWAFQEVSLGIEQPQKPVTVDRMYYEVSTAVQGTPITTKVIAGDFSPNSKIQPQLAIQG